METECNLLIEVFCLFLSQGEEIMETGPEGTSNTAETKVYYFHIFISE